MAARDRVVRWALGVGGVLVVLSWHFVGPWVALVILLLTLGVAAAAYRVEAPKIDVDRPATWADTSAERTSAGRMDQ